MRMLTRLAAGLGALVVALGATTPVSATTTGTDWTIRQSAADSTWLSVAYGNGVFVAVAGSSATSVMTSTDGITWTARTGVAGQHWTSVVFGGGQFVAVSSSGTNNKSMTSSDGITWTPHVTNANTTWNSVTYGNGLYVATAQSGGANGVMTSLDGATWTRRASSVSNAWMSVTFGDGKCDTAHPNDVVPCFVSVSAAGTQKVMTSPDGITWTTRSASNLNMFAAVTYGNGLFVAVSPYGTGDGVMTSPDAVSWTTRVPAADNDWFAVTYGDGLFVAVANTGTNNRIMTSPDGITWTSQVNPVDNDWYSVAYGNGMFVAVAATGTGNRVMTSGSMPQPVLDASQWTVIHQGLPLSATGACTDVDDAAVAYGTGLTGGWQRGWAPWAGPRLDGVAVGGWACERTITNTGGTRWVVGSS